MPWTNTASLSPASSHRMHYVIDCRMNVNLTRESCQYNYLFHSFLLTKWRLCGMLSIASYIMDMCLPHDHVLMSIPTFVSVVSCCLQSNAATAREACRVSCCTSNHWREKWTEVYLKWLSPVNNTCVHSYLVAWYAEAALSIRTVVVRGGRQLLRKTCLVILSRHKVKNNVKAKHMCEKVTIYCDNAPSLPSAQPFYPTTNYQCHCMFGSSSNTGSPMELQCGHLTYCNTNATIWRNNKKN